MLKAGNNPLTLRLTFSRPVSKTFLLHAMLNTERHHVMPPTLLKCGRQAHRFHFIMYFTLAGIGKYVNMPVKSGAITHHICHPRIRHS